MKKSAFMGGLSDMFEAAGFLREVETVGGGRRRALVGRRLLDEPKESSANRSTLAVSYCTCET